MVYLWITEELHFRTCKLHVSLLRIWLYFGGRECKEGRVSIVKIKNKWRPTLKISWVDKTSPLTPTKVSSTYFMKPTPPGSFIFHASGNHIKTSQSKYEATPDQFLIIEENSNITVFCKLGIHAKSISQSSSFVFLNVLAWNFPFSILHLRLKFFYIVKG